jgi:hypothetical protein
MHSKVHWFLLFFSSNLVWREFSILITTTLAHIVDHPVARMDHTPKEIIFNLPHTSIVRYISDPPSRTILLHLVQEIKRDIIHRRMTITSPRGPIPLLHSHAHLLSVINKVASQMDYKGSKSQSDMMHMMHIMTGSLQHMIPVHCRVN